MTPKLKQRLVVIIVLTVVVLIISRFFGLSVGKTKLVAKDGSSGVPSHATARKDNPAGDFLDLFKTSIELYGRVEDQNGKPVAGATVTLTPVDSPSGDTSRSKTFVTTDAKGEFSVKGLHMAFSL